MSQIQIKADNAISLGGVVALPARKWVTVSENFRTVARQRGCEIRDIEDGELVSDEIIAGESTVIGSVNTRLDQIVTATKAVLALGDDALTTSKGLPTVEALEAELGFDVTSQERDEAFKLAK